MALAYLCSQLKSLTPDPEREHRRHVLLQQLRFRAFVVDHKARYGSTEEARRVLEPLSKTGGSLIFD